MHQIHSLISTLYFQLPVEIIIEIRRILAGLILFMLVFDLIFTFVLIGATYLHRRHIRNIAEREGLTVTFKARGPAMWKIYTFFFVAYFIVFIVGSVLTALGFLPLMLTPSMEELILNIVLILMFVLIVCLWPTLMIIGLWIDIKGQRESLRVARGK